MKILRRVWCGKRGVRNTDEVNYGSGAGGRGGYQASVSSETAAQDLILSYCNCM